MNIAVDIDGILANADVAFRAQMRRLFRRPFPKNKVKTFHYEDSFDLSEKEIEELYKLFLDEDLWLKMKPVKGAVESIKKLSLNHRIIIVTARPREVKAVTIKWLQLNDISYEEIYFTLANKHLMFENHNENVDIFIEDHPVYTRRIAASGIKVIMFKYPWNNEVEDVENIYKVTNWPQAMDCIRMLSHNFEKTNS
jgi:uncharacterized HAD superfamily protein